MPLNDTSFENIYVYNRMMNLRAVGELSSTNIYSEIQIMKENKLDFISDPIFLLQNQLLLKIFCLCCGKAGKTYYYK